MRHVNILWPSEMENEYLRLFKECTGIASEADLEDEEQFEKRLDTYIQINASSALKEWLSYVGRIEQESA